MLDSGVETPFLRRWLSSSEALGAGSEIAIEALAGDVSPRRYYRVLSRADRAIVAYYPVELRPVALRFQRTTELLEEAGVRVPAIRRFDEDAGLMLLEDVGTETLFDRRDCGWQGLRPWLALAFEAVGRVRTIAPAALHGLLPPLDAAALERELQMTWDVFLLPNELLGDDALRARLRGFLERLCAELEADGLVPCHRDFMARNLVPLTEGGGAIAVLDHQDLRLGPLAYDTASLFNDSLYPPRAAVREVAGTGVFDDAAYHRAVVQRTLKIVGTFASFARRGHARYLPLVAPSLGRCLEHLAELPEAHDLVADLRRTWARALAPAGAGSAGAPLLE
jgi:aminoglycoside/choline kinase family phosphotransferase